MTGFGRSEYVDEDKKIAIEIKSVNHRYSDINIKMPRKFNQFEAAMRTVLKDYIERGKVDVFVTYEDYAKSNLVVKYNKVIAAEYIGHLEQMKQDFGLNEDFKPTVIADFPEVFSLEEKSEIDNSLYETIEKTLREAGENFSKARAVEGENLKNDMLAKLDEMAAMVDKIEEMSPTLIAEYREKLTTNVKELIEEGCLLQGNITSLCGKYGGNAKHNLELLVKKHMIHFMGTDTHRSIYPLNDCYIMLSKIVDINMYKDITANNFEKVVNNEKIEPYEIVKAGGLFTIEKIK